MSSENKFAMQSFRSKHGQPSYLEVDDPEEWFLHFYSTY